MYGYHKKLFRHTTSTRHFVPVRIDHKVYEEDKPIVDGYVTDNHTLPEPLTINTVIKKSYVIRPVVVKRHTYVEHRTPFVKHYVKKMEPVRHYVHRVRHVIPEAHYVENQE